MKKIIIVLGLLVAATAASAQGQSNYRPYAAGPGVTDDFGAGSGRGFDARITRVNAPGGAYIDCDPRNPSSPVRCTPDGW